MVLKIVLVASVAAVEQRWYFWVCRCSYITYYHTCSGILVPCSVPCGLVNDYTEYLNMMWEAVTSFGTPRICRPSKSTIFCCVMCAPVEPVVKCESIVASTIVTVGQSSMSPLHRLCHCKEAIDVGSRTTTTCYDSIVLLSAVCLRGLPAIHTASLQHPAAPHGGSRLVFFGQDPEWKCTNMSTSDQTYLQ